MSNASPSFTKISKISIVVTTKEHHSLSFEKIPEVGDRCNNIFAVLTLVEFGFSASNWFSTPFEESSLLYAPTKGATIIKQKFNEVAYIPPASTSGYRQLLNDAYIPKQQELNVEDKQKQEAFTSVYTNNLNDENKKFGKTVITSICELLDKFLIDKLKLSKEFEFKFVLVLTANDKTILASILLPYLKKSDAAKHKYLKYKQWK